MKKRALISEPSNITRQVAETVLRQNGFEVIAVSYGEGLSGSGAEQPPSDYCQWLFFRGKTCPGLSRVCRKNLCFLLFL